MSPPIRVFDRYEIIRRLASGGMGDIFLARQVGLAGFQRLVILKSLRPELTEDEDLVAQFLNEAQTIARLNHPNVVAVFEVDEYRGVFFIAMEYIEGADLMMILRESVRERQRIPFRVSAGIIHDAALGLAHAHASKDPLGRGLKLVHRDISTQNVMVRLDGIAKVLDFGIATMMGAGTSRGTIQGKPSYMSPEQACGRDLTAASDQFSLGVVAWELCTQRRMYTQKEPRKILNEVAAGRIPKLASIAPDVPPELEKIVMRMLQRNAGDRFGDCKELVAALRAFLDSTGGPADRSIERFVKTLLGANITSRVKDLTPEPVIIPGLLQAADIACARCNFQNELRNRFCAQCGAPLYQDTSDVGVEQASVKAPTPRPRNRDETLILPAPIARHSAHALVFDRELDAQNHASRETQAIILAARILSRGRFIEELGVAAARHLERRLIAALTATAEAFGAQIIRLNAEELVLAFIGNEADSALRALRCATELETEIRKTSASQRTPFTISIGLARGPIPLEHSSSAHRAFELTTALVESGQSGVFAGEDTVELLGSVARFIPASVAGARRLERFFGETPNERIPLIGRQKELAKIRSVLTDCTRGQAAALLFVGDPGSGKTRLIDESELAANKRGFIAVRLTCSQGEAERVPDVLKNIVMSLCSALSPSPDRSRHPAERLADVGLPPAIVSAVLSALLDPTRSTDATPAERLADEAAMRHAIIAIATAKPTVILADDVHLANDETWSELGSLFEHSRGAKLAFIGAAGELGRSIPPWIGEQFALTPLTDDKILALARAFADDIHFPPVAAQLVLEHAGGNPGALRLIIEALIAGGGLERQDARWVATPFLHNIDLVPRFQGLLRARIERMDAALRVFLELGAVAGLSFEVSAVLVASGVAAESPEKIIEAALKSRFVVPSLAPSKTSGRLLRFIQPSYRDALLTRLSREELQNAHEAIGRATLASSRNVSGDGLVAVATHLLAGEARMDASYWALRAAGVLAPGEQAYALIRAAFHTCAARLEAGEPVTDELSKILEKYGARAIVTLAVHDTDEAEQLYGSIEPFVAGAISHAAEASLLHQRARLRLTGGKIKDAEKDLSRALKLCDGENQDALRAKLFAAQAEMYEKRGELPQAIEEVLKSLRLAQDADVGEDFLWTQSNALGRLFFRMSDTLRAMELFEVAHQQAVASASERGQAAALGNRASVLAMTGQIEEALELFASVIPLAERAGDGIGVARGLYNRGRILARLNRLTESRDALEQSVRAALASGWAEGEAVARQALEALSVQAKSW